MTEKDKLYKTIRYILYLLVFLLIGLPILIYISLAFNGYP